MIWKGPLREDDREQQIQVVEGFTSQGVNGIVLAPSHGDSLVPMVGASGAIAGVLAAYLVLYPHGRVRVLVFLGFFVTVIVLPALIVIGFWILLQFFSGIASLGPETRGTEGGGVAYFAHIGGFVAGLALVFLFRDRRALARSRRYRAWD